jgi:hypothetical protein
MAAAAAASGPVPPPPAPPLGPGCTLEGDGHAGELFVQGVVESAGRSGRLDDVLDSAGRWVLFGWELDPLSGLDAGLAGWYAEMGGIGCHLGPRNVVDLHGTFGEWFASSGVSVVLARPDFVVFGTAADAADAGRLLRASRTGLAGRPR